MLSTYPVTFFYLFLCAAAVGCVPSPFDCYMANRGLKTLHLRMREHEKNAIAVTKYLEKSPFVEQVFYPGRYICT